MKKLNHKPKKNLQLLSSKGKKTFCVYPFIYSLIGPDPDTVQLCCKSENIRLKHKENKNFSFKTQTPDEIWNSQSMRTIRKKMLLGEKVPNCAPCYYEESLGQVSDRQRFNYYWLNDIDFLLKMINNKLKRKKHKFSIKIYWNIVRDRVILYIKKFKWRTNKKNYPYKRNYNLVIKNIFKSITNEFKSPSPIYMELKPGNLCNLKCRMCGPKHSSKVQTETDELIQENKDNADFFSLNELNRLKISKDWFKRPELLKNLYRWAPSLRQLHLTGGETTLIKEAWDIIDYLKSNGFSKNITLQMHINCTNIPEKLLNIFKYFKRVELYLSIDGYKEVQEYIRYPSKWEDIEKNILRLSKSTKGLNKFMISFEPVVQIYNILYLPEMLEWMGQFERFFIHANMLKIPTWLNIAILPKNIKQAALKKLTDYESKNRHYFYYSLSMKGIKTVLQNPPIENEDEAKYYLKRFHTYTKMLDKKRGQSFKQSLPELYEMLEKDGSWREGAISLNDKEKKRVRQVGLFNQQIV